MDNIAFYNRILNGEETKEDIEKFYNMCQDYSDIYKDMHGFRPRGEGCRCVNAYSGNPNIEEFREQLKRGINYLMAVYDFVSDVSKEQILDRHPEYEQYFV